MPNGGGLDQEILGLYMEMLKQKVKDQYRGHEDYHLMLNAIDSNVPIVGGEIKVLKEDSHGNIRTVKYHVTVKDDLGNFIKSIDDLGGQCIKGEIVKKGYIFTCMECGELFCRRHVKFVDNDPEKPLCRYGFMGRGGCYTSYANKHSTGVSQGDIIKLEKQIQEEELKAKLSETRKKREAIEKGQYVLEDPRQLPTPKKTGLLGNVKPFSILCGNPQCNERIKLVDIPCPSCRHTITIDSGMPLTCPVCGESITQIECPNCEAINEL
jgi:hypothetical protein